MRNLIVVGAKIGRLGAVAVVLAAASSLSIAAPAYAADELELSSDGIHFSQQLDAGLFGDIANIVPTDNQYESFYLRNSGGSDGFLRITLRDVTATNTVYSDALTISVGAGTVSGSPVALSRANPCFVLNEGLRVSPGSTVKVSTVLALADLAGDAGQGSSATLAIRLTLSGADTGSLAPTDCGMVGTDIRPPAHSPAATEPSGPGGTAHALPIPTATPGAEPTAAPTATATPTAQPPLPIGLSAAHSNTSHLFQEYFVFLPVLAFVVGAGLFFLVARRRRGEDDDTQADGGTE